MENLNFKSGMENLNFNWSKELKQENITEVTWEQLKIKAASWLTSPVGLLINIDRFNYGALAHLPKDSILQDLHKEFSRAIRDKNKAEAVKTLIKIKKRGFKVRYL